MTAATEGSSTTKRPNLQTERSSLSTARLLTATAELIAERGFEQTTLAEIGKRAGYSHGLVTRRFGSKTKLVQSLIERLSSRFGHEKLPETLADRAGVDALLQVITEIRNDATRSSTALRGFYALLFEGIRPIPILHEEVARMNADFARELTEYTARGHETGRLRNDVHPEDITNLTINALRGLAYRWMVDPESIDFIAGLDVLAAQITTLADPDAPSA
jgi:AcrR family transcriptional regulator